MSKLRRISITFPEDLIETIKAEVDLVVLLVPNCHPPDGLWHVATAWPADRRTRKVYDAEEAQDG